MLDPWTALSLAASIAQFIDFGSEVVRQTKEIQNRGSSVDTHHLVTITVDLINVNQNLKAQIRSRTAQKVQSTPEEQDLDDLSVKCNDLAQELIDRLNKITTGLDAGKWDSLRAALKGIWSKDHIEDLARRLNDYRQQVTIRILVLLNKHIGTLRQSNDEIIEVISVNFGEVKAILENQHDKLSDHLQSDRTAANQQHQDVMAALALLTSRSGKTQTISRPGSTAGSNPTQSVPGHFQTATRYRRTLLGANIEDELPDFNRSDFSHVPTRILDSLYFRAIDDRREIIADAHRATFQWIFEDPQEYDKPWASFIDWLTDGKGCYWISGKAGSGKSTLMKYIWQDPRTQQALLRWAGPATFVGGSFFFWAAGSALQKSQAGLLRSLLHTILCNRQELIPILFPSLTRAALAGLISQPCEPSPPELKAALRTLITSGSMGMKICFLIDGLDEYDGDHNEISELLLQIATSPSIKIVLSSRPIPACVYAFSESPHLRMQDLTRDDIARYVQDKIGANPIMQRLQAREQSASVNLIDGILSKASGVFLWVILVTKSLLNGLQDYDHISDLLRRLDALPADLEQLYRHMLHSADSTYRQQASKILQLMLRSIQIQGKFPITVLQLSYAEEDHNKATQAPIAGISTQEEEWRCDAVEGRLRSRCCGLVEIQDFKKFSPSDRSGLSIGFMHTTVMEFLQIPAIWDDILSMTVGTSFNVDRALLVSCLCEMRAKPPEPGDLKNSRAYDSLFRLATYGMEMKSIMEPTQSIFLMEVVNTIEQYWPNKPGRWLVDSQSERDAVSDAAAQACDRLKLTFPNSLLFLLVCRGPLAVFYDLHKHFISHNVESVYKLPAYLLMQVFEDIPSSMREAIALGIRYCAPDPDRENAVLQHAMEGPSRRWTKILDPKITQGWSLWKFVLYHVFVLCLSSVQDMKTLNNLPAIESIFNILETLSGSKSLRSWQRCCFVVDMSASLSSVPCLVDEIAVVQQLKSRALDLLSNEQYAVPDDNTNSISETTQGSSLRNGLVTTSESVLMFMATRKLGKRPDEQLFYVSTSGAREMYKVSAMADDRDIPVNDRFEMETPQADRKDDASMALALADRRGIPIYDELERWSLHALLIILIALVALLIILRV